MGDVCIRLESVVDWPGFSRAVRALRAAGIGPESVRWQDGDTRQGATGDLFGGGELRPADMADGPPLSLPRPFVEAAREVFLHADPARLPLLHRLALRIADDAAAWSDPLHADRLQFDRCLREVRREIHKMHAFVRFRRLAPSDAAPFDDTSDTAMDEAFEAGKRAGDPAAEAAAAERARAARVRHVAWFEPAHHVLEAAAPFFARRFAQMHWAILTPRASVQWDGRALAFGPGARREEAPAADAGEALWLAYYRSIFNPARVKVAMMKKEMPVRFWKNLPEAAAIPALLSEAPRRQQTMVDAGGSERSRRRGAWAGTGVATGSAVAADSVATLDQLAREVARCRDCPGSHAATQTVFGEGDASARVMIVGVQPGDQEDLRGLPFQGPAGQLLREAVRELGWPAEALYLTNAVKHFHFELRGKRRLHKTPGQHEALACLHWLEAEIAALRPRAIVALGATALRSLLGTQVSVTAHEGRWLARPDGTPVLVCLHPSALLRADPSRQAALRTHWLDSLRQASVHVLTDDGVEVAGEATMPSMSVAA